MERPSFKQFFASDLIFWMATNPLPRSIAIELVVAPRTGGARGKVISYRIEVSPLTARPSQLPEAVR